MKRGIWTFALSGMLAASQSVFAADPFDDQPAGRVSVGSGRSSTSGSSRTAKKTKESDRSNAKNYYNDLFNDEEDSLPPSRYAKRVPPVAAESRDVSSELDDDEFLTEKAKTPVKSKAKLPEFDDIDLTVEETPSRPERGPNRIPEKPAKASRVTHAAFDRSAGSKNSVQQTRSEGRPKSAPPMSGLEELNDRPVRNPIAKESKPRPTAERSDRITKSEPRSEMIRPVKNEELGSHKSQISVEWVKRGEFNVGQECLVDLIIRNTGESSVTDMAVDAYFPTTVRLTSAEPNPSSATDRLTWQFEEFAAATEQKITIKLVPHQTGDVGASAQIRFTEIATAEFAVSEPLLKVAVKSAAKEFMLGDPTSQMITVTNPGTGTVHDVKIEAKLSEGLEHPSGEDRLLIDVGAVGPGETRTYRLPLTASKGGPQSVSVVATSSSDVSSTDSAKFEVIAPSIKVAVDGPGLRYKGRNAKYTLTVTNDGSVVNSNIHVSQSIADGFKFIAADRSGKFDPSVRCIHWFIDRLEPGESTQVACELQSLQLGEFAHTVQAVADSGVQSDARIETRVDGISSLTMEVIDLDDPIETGSESGYEIRVKNDGSKPASRVMVSCELPAGVEFLSAKAPVEESIEGRQLTFEPIDQIAPGGQVTIRVVTKVLRDGSHRMRVKLSSEGQQEPIVLEEVTRAYSDGSN